MSSEGTGDAEVFEPSAVLEPDGGYDRSSGSRKGGEGKWGGGGSELGGWLKNQSRVLRVQVLGTNNVKKLDFRVPVRLSHLLFQYQ